MKAAVLKYFAFFLAFLTMLFGWQGLLAAPAAPTQTAVVRSDALARARYPDFYGNAAPFAVVPGLKEQLIPQGIACSEALNAYLVSGYYEDGALPSVLCVLDEESGALQKTLTLANEAGEPQTGHFGGVAAWNGYVYASTGGRLYIYEASAVAQCKNGETLTAAAVAALPDKGSFCTAGRDLLVTGNFVSDEDAENAAGTTVNGEKFCASLHVYRLSEGAPFGLEGLSDETLIPAGEALIPNEVQGVALTPDGTLWLSCSYGRNRDSRIYAFADFAAAAKGEGSSAFALSPAAAAKAYLAPPMAEGMAACPGGVALLFESGAAKYRLQMGLCPTDKIWIIK